jgi:YtkA-like
MGNQRIYGSSLLLAAVVVALALLGLSSCGGGDATGSGKTRIQQQTVDQLTIALEGPERAPLLMEQPITITLTDASGTPVDGAEVWIGVGMPTMQMRPNEPDAAATGNGRYRANVLYTMAGTWSLEVHATLHGQEYVATFHTQTV